MSSLTTMPFGKHRGQPLADVPGPYLRWLLGNADQLFPETRAAIETDLRRREQRGAAATVPAATKPPAPPARVSPPSPTCGICGLGAQAEQPLVHRTCATDEVPF